MKKELKVSRTLNKTILVLLVITLTGTINNLKGQSQFPICEITATYNHHCTGLPVTVGPCFSPTSNPTPCPTPLLTIYEGESVTFDVTTCGGSGSCSPQVGVWWEFTGPITITTPHQATTNWTQQFNVAGTYSVVAWQECGTAPNTTIVPLIIQEQMVVLPVSAFHPTLTGQQNNCPNPFGISYYVLSFPPQMNPLSADWYLYGMDNVTNPVAVNLLPPLPFGIDWSQYTLDASATAAEICVQYTTEDCGSGEVCIPIYPCCECPPVLPHTDCLSLNNVSSSELWNDPDVSVFLTTNTGGTTILSTSAVLMINGTFTVDNDFTFEDCPSIWMAPEAKFLIKSSAVLTFSSPMISHAAYVPNPSNPSNPGSGTGYATEVTTGCDIMWDGIYFEDASAQLFINPGGITNYVTIRHARNAVVSDFGAPFDIHYGYFLNNNKDVVVNTFVGAGQHPGVIENSVLTTDPFYGMRQYYTPSTIILNSPLPRTHVGIEISDVEHIQIGSTNAANVNQFSNMDVGIWSKQSWLTAYNNSFNKIHRVYTPCTHASCPPEGICILGQATYSTTHAANVPSAKLHIGALGMSNIFTDSDIGTSADGKHDMDIGYNSFTDMKSGVEETNSFQSAMTLHDNTMDHFNRGINMTNNKSSVISIANNNFNTTNILITQGATAIAVQEPLLSQATSPAVTISANTIKYAPTGIQASNLFNANITGINDIYYPVNHPASAAWAGYGIRVQNNNKTNIIDNVAYRCNVSMINGNPIAGCPPGATPADNYTKYLQGISVETSTNTFVNNNAVAYFGTGIRNFNSFLPNTYRCNTMAYCQWMLWLDNSNPGPQGSSTTSQGNQWRSTNYTNLLADVWMPLPSPPNQGPWYVSSLALPDAPQIQLPNPGVALQSGAGANNSCSYPAIIGNNPGDVQKQLANLLRWTKDPECTFTEQGKFLAQLEIYKELLSNSDLMNPATVDGAYLQQFYNDEANNTIGQMANVKILIGEEDYEGAKTENSTITPENQAATNEKATNAIYLATWAKDLFVLTEEQRSTLQAIAEQSPISGGPAVYTARVMLGINYDDYGASEERLSKEEQLAEAFMSVYPNPASSILNIEYSLGQNETGEFILADLLGRVIKKQKLYSALHVITLSIKDIEGGAYFVSIRMIDKNKIVKKLIIAH